MTSAQWRTVIDINLTGNFLISHALLPLMKDRGWGRIINIGSASIFSGVAGQAHYVAAKAGLVGLTRSLASPDSDFITGQTLNVDGGMFMN